MSNQPLDPEKVTEALNALTTEPPADVDLSSLVGGRVHAGGGPVVHPLVRIGTPANFQLQNRHWHRTESYPEQCLCGYPPSQATYVKPFMDDSWRYSSQDTWQPCISKLAKKDEEWSSVGDGDTTFRVGDRVSIVKDAAHLYEQGKSSFWTVEEIGRRASRYNPIYADEPAPVVRLLDRSTGIYVWAPIAWVEPWKPEPKEEPMSMAVPERFPITATIKFTPTDDTKITCVLCGGAECTHEYSARAAGRRSTLGVHEDCVQGIIGVEIK